MKKTIIVHVLFDLNNVILATTDSNFVIVSI